MAGPFDAADDKDWDRLFAMLDDSAHGQFWKQTFTEFLKQRNNVLAARECEQTAKELRENSNGDCNAIMQAIRWETKAAEFRALALVRNG